ncbi:hypothetical protein BFR04_08520 [Gaetbulibacter sp. 4G1]|nr:hypothetical protein [Gaetbulibacter sp. 4G1]PIA77476.1 hypothetical protein BFR04_08520 [Gaetbulibacter sp. 4G1]
MAININLKSFFKKLTLFISFLLVFNLFDILTRIHFGSTGIVSKLSIYFNFNEEASIPTLYSFVVLFTSALLLFFIFNNSKANKLKSYMWLGLSLIFIFLAIDEILQIHEKLSWVVQNRLNTTGIFWFAWVIPYFLFAVLVFLIYARFLMGLEKKIRNLFILSGIIFVVGAIGFELIESNIHFTTRQLNTKYYLLASCEEFMEMFGVNLFIYALLYHIKNDIATLNIKLY